MKRRDFFRNGSLAFLGTTLLSPWDAIASASKPQKGQAKNIIFLVSDGMSTGTLNMADLLSRRKLGAQSNWLKLYSENLVHRALMDTASASSLVTDSAAASSSWGGGKRVPNGSLNTNADGSENKPIWQKFKAAGKAAGCVTTVPITHATPAGFCVSHKSRNDQAGIALKYLDLNMDVLMGGGLEYFMPDTRKDGIDLFKKYEQAGYSVLRNRQDLLQVNTAQSGPLLGVFHKDGLPYSLDRAHNTVLEKQVPTLLEMTQTAIKQLSKNKAGFVLQVEAGKVDWAAHANDVGAMLYEQLAFDEVVKEAIAFAAEDKETLVIVTTDHGNANPGLTYGGKADEQFDRIQTFKGSNQWILDGVDRHFSAASLIDKIESAQGYAIKKAEAESIMKHYQDLDGDGLYNPRNLPYRELAMVQEKYTSVGWASMNHTADYVELAMYGPGSELLKPFVQNIELHQLMLQATGVKAS